MNTLQQNREQAEAYLRGMVQVKSPAEQIADAKALLDAGTISTDEYNTLKAKALNCPRACCERQKAACVCGFFSACKSQTNVGKPFAWRRADLIRIYAKFAILRKSYC